MRAKIVLLLTAVFQLSVALGQAQLSTDTSVKVFPHWKKGESHSVAIKSTTEDFSNGKTTSYLSQFDAKFSVLEKDTSGYILEWTYTKATVAPNEVTFENNLLADLVGAKLLIKLSLAGRFKELVNADEVRSLTEKTIDKLIENSGNTPAMTVQYKAAKQMVSTRQGLEIALLKQIKFYNLSFGFNYKINSSQTSRLKFPNPLGGQAFDAIEKVLLTKLDNAKNICVIETSKNVDGSVLKNDVIEYLKNISKKDAAAIENDLRNEKLEFTESTMQQIDFSKGIVLNANFTRRMNFGFQKRTTSIEIETVN